MCGCGMDTIPLFLGVLFNRYFLCFYTSGVNTFVFSDFTSLYSYSLCLDVFYRGIIPTRVCIEHSYACTAAGEMAMLFGYSFPPHSSSLAGYILAWLCWVQSSCSHCITKYEYKNRNSTERLLLTRIPVLSFHYVEVSS